MMFIYNNAKQDYVDTAVHHIRKARNPMYLHMHFDADKE